MPLDGAVADARLGGLDDETRYGSLHVALPDGKALPAGWGCAAVAAWLPGLRWVAWLVARAPAAGPALDRFYRWAAPKRGAIARFVPDVDPVEHPGH